MPTFRRRNSIVDARQFNGERQNGLDLILWINSNQGRATWYDENNRFVLHERSRMSIVHPNYWVVLNQDGSFNRMSPEDFNEEFEQV